MPNKVVLSFKPKTIAAKLVGSLANPRAKDVITSRYGLGTNTDFETLESIGGKYGITRERVRQIENHSLTQIRKSDAYEELQAYFTELEKLIHSLGCVVAEKDLLDHLSKNDSIRNSIHFMLTVGDAFVHEKEDEHFKKRWCIDNDLSDKIKSSLHKIYESLSDSDLLADPDMVQMFLNHMEDVAEEFKQEEVIRRWISISKKINRNPLGEWGKAESSNVNLKGVRDYAYLVLRKHGSPIHFKDVAKEIKKVFGHAAHVATTHNELIKDNRFVLVGRGLYALREWGYMSGVVKDVIEHIIKKYGPMTKEDVIKNVLKERYVKENTIMVNLQNKKYFKRLPNGKFDLAK